MIWTGSQQQVSRPQKARAKDYTIRPKLEDSRARTGQETNICSDKEGLLILLRKGHNCHLSQPFLGLLGH